MRGKFDSFISQVTAAFVRRCDSRALHRLTFESIPSDGFHLSGARLPVPLGNVTPTRRDSMKRQLSRAFVCIIIWAILCGEATAQTIEFKTTQVTDAEMAVSPDGKMLVFSVLGHLFGMPSEGGTAEQLTFGACYDNDPAFSPDGGRIAFVSDRDGSGGNVFLLEFATRKLMQVTRETHAGQPTWSPDGKAILYLRHLPRDKDPRRGSMFGALALCELRRISIGEDEKPEKLRSPGLIRSVFYLAGEQPAWTVVEQETNAGSMFPRSTTHVETINLKDGRVSRLRTLQGDLGRVAVSPKGDGLYSRSSELRFLPLPEGAPKRVSALAGGAGGFGGGSPIRFAVTADGKTAYLSGRGQILKVALETGEREPVAFNAQVKLEVAGRVRPNWGPLEVGGKARARAVLGPQLSPNGRSLIFMAGGYLWEQSLEGKPARRLTAGDALEREPALSPDGRHLAFVRTQNGKRELRVLDLESRQARTLADLAEGSWARFPSWSNDGRRLVFQKSDSFSAPFGLVAVNLADGKLEKLAGAAGDWSTRPHFDPAGDALYFTTRISDLGGLYRLPLHDKGDLKAVSQLARHLSEARVSPDGKWLAFRRNTEIWVAPLGTEAITEQDVRRLSSEGGATFGFTPDGSAVVYSVGARVWRHPLNGGERQEIPVRLDWKVSTPPPLLVRGVRVLDLAAGKFSEATSLLIESGAIRWIGEESEQKLPADTAVLDAAGKYAIPGLFDFHVHSAWANYDANPDTFLAYGITSVRDTGGGLEMLCALADRGEISGDPVPRYFFSGEIFEGAQPIWGDAFLKVYTAEDARNLVKQYSERGAHFIKVYASLPFELQRAVAEEARRQGIPVAGHGLGLEEIVKSVTQGYVSLEHCPMSLNDDLRQLLVATGTRCDPTLAILGGHSNLLRREPKRLDDAKLHAFFSESFIRGARAGGFPGGGAAWPGRLAEIKAAYRGGVKLQAGTDALMTGTFFGASLHWELEHLAEAGLKPIEVLRLATEEAAAGVGAAGQLGALAPGKQADIVLLDADPLESIRNTQAIWRVMKGGWLFDPGELRLRK
jgi:imidazolonepropionase-like amidohydrolase/Tol biopolymer transport system component